MGFPQKTSFGDHISASFDGAFIDEYRYLSLSEVFPQKPLEAAFLGLKTQCFMNLVGQRGGGGMDCCTFLAAAGGTFCDLGEEGGRGGRGGARISLGGGWGTCTFCGLGGARGGGWTFVHD